MIRRFPSLTDTVILDLVRNFSSVSAVLVVEQWKSGGGLTAWVVIKDLGQLGSRASEGDSNNTVPY